MNERDRIEFLMKCYNLTPSQLADKAGIQRASVSHILSGRNRASLEVMQKLHDAFPDVDLLWLITGNGDAPSINIPPANDVQSVSNTTALFSSPEDVPVEPVANKVREEEYPRQRQEPVKKVSRKQNNTRHLLQAASSGKQVKEVRIFYTDGTYETLFPER